MRSIRMRLSFGRRRSALLTAMAVLALSSPSIALRAPDGPRGRYDYAYQPRAGGAVAIAPQSLADLPAGDSLRTAWESFVRAQSGGWSIYL
ncbi:MAG: hypothetical protein JSV80_17695, partial [Acidobacteriota bacterium]